jgi:hypothetical protein
MRLLSLVTALTLLIGSLWFFLGGAGPLMRRELVFGQLASSVAIQWALLCMFLAVWWGGALFCTFRARALFGALRATSSVPWRLGEGLVLAGHAALLAVGFALALGMFGRSLSFPPYGLLMIAGALYAAGLGSIAWRHGAAIRR